MAGGSVLSYTVKIIPEDPSYNGYILKPLVETILKNVGKPNADVSVLTNPKVSGYEHAKKLLKEEIVERYLHMDLLLFMPDADGKDKSDELYRLEGYASDKKVNLICCAAVQEVEIWLLAGHKEKLSDTWKNIRANRNVKESVFEPFLKSHGDTRRAGKGRDLLMEASLSNYKSLKKLCPEIETLENRIKESFTS